VELSPPLWPTVPAHVLPPKVGQHETSQKRVKKKRQQPQQQYQYQYQWQLQRQQQQHQITLTNWLKERLARRKHTHQQTVTYTATQTHRPKQLVELPELKAVVNLFLGLGL